MKPCDVSGITLIALQIQDDRIPDSGADGLREPGRGPGFDTFGTRPSGAIVVREPMIDGEGLPLHGHREASHGHRCLGAHRRRCAGGSARR